MSAPSTEGGRRRNKPASSTRTRPPFEWPDVYKRHAKSPQMWGLYVANGLALFAVGLIVLLGWNRDKWQLGWHYEAPADKPLPQMLIFALPVFFVLMAVEMLHAKWTRGSVRSAYRLNDVATSIFTGSYQQATALAFFRGLGLLPYAWLREKTAVLYADESVTLVNWLFCLITIEYCYYWVHRFAHEWNVLWAGHIVHHSGQDYNLATALRQSWWQGVYSWCFYLPMAPFFPVALFVWHSQFSLIYQYWIHTRAIDRLPWPLELVLNTPSHHRVHHGRQSQYIDKNYGGTLIIFDRIFGTFTPEREEVVYGVTTDFFSSWNVLWIQHCQFLEIWDTFKTMLHNKPRGLSQAAWYWECARVFLDRGPGFNYEILRPELIANPPPDITPENEIKYDNDMPNSVMWWYGAIHATLAIGVTYGMIVVASIPNTPSLWLLGIWAYLTLHMCAVGVLFDGKSYAKKLELFRLVLTAGIAIGFNATANEPSAVPNGARWTVVAFCVASAAVLVRFYSTVDERIQQKLQ